MSLLTPSILAAARVKTLNAFNDAQASATPFARSLGLTQKIPDGTEIVLQWLARTLTRMEEWPEGSARSIKGVKERAFYSATKRYQETAEVSRLQLSRNVDSGINYFAAMASQFGDAIGLLEDDLVMQVLTSGQSMLGYDGQNVYDTDHPTDLDSSGSQSNYSVSGMALTPANFRIVRSIMRSYTGEDGRPLNVLPDTLLVPPALEAAANEAVKAEFLASGASNVSQLQAKVVVRAELAAIGNTTWFMFDTSSKGTAFALSQQVEAPELTTITAPDSHHTFMTDNYLMGARAVHQVIPAAWYRSYKATA